MEVTPIQNEEQYQTYLDWVDNQLNKKVTPESTEGQKLQVILLLIEKYEDEHYKIPYPSTLDAIKGKMSDLGIRNKDLVGKFGSKGYISSMLNGKKPLSLPLIKWFNKELGIPAEILLQ